MIRAKIWNLSSCQIFDTLLCDSVFVLLKNEVGKVEGLRYLDFSYQGEIVLQEGRRNEERLMALDIVESWEVRNVTFEEEDEKLVVELGHVKLIN